MTGGVPIPADAADPLRFQQAIERFDQENARDPHHEIVSGQAVARELLFAQRLTEWVLQLCPRPSEALLLAARSQHLCRWMIPRSSYEMNRAGYLRWRAELKNFHAEKSGEILRNLAYPESVVARVQALNLKRDFPADPECRILEDALCLVFLQYQLGELAQKTSREKVINALRKCWRKVTPEGRARALQLAYSAAERDLLREALSGEDVEV